MKSRDTNGRFVKKTNEENQLTLIFPSLKSLLYWILMLFIFFPWIAIISKLNLFEKMKEILESLLISNNEESSDNGKKSGLFY